jgi:ribosomal subunit interface protein
MFIEIKSRNMELDAKKQAYAEKKLGGLEKFIARADREVASIQVMLEDDPSGREQNGQVCEAIVTLPGAKMVVREGTLNIYAAIDIVESKLKNQLRDYKEKNSPRQSRLRALSAWRERRTRRFHDDEAGE